MQKSIKIKKINWLDLLATIVILTSLRLINLSIYWWLLYAFGCFLWIILMVNKKLYFGAIMNLIAIGIAVWNVVGAK